MVRFKLALLFLLCLLMGCDQLSATDEPLPKNSACAAGAPCTFSNGVKVWLSDAALSPETPFSIFAKLPAGFVITDAKLEGVTMYMGFIPQQFKRQGNVWQSDTMVGICAENNMLWKLALTITNNTSLQSSTVYYYFYVNY
ncbi:hypothetical protein [Pseudoalteromonas sp.]|uniref:hypothetical protein n=1 Tax=Pseudoalteromonas sp. TaxID=53249 RepID=UPI00356A606E